MNIICFGARAVGPFVAWDILEGFLGAKFTQEERHRRRLARVGAVELERASQKASA